MYIFGAHDLDSVPKFGPEVLHIINLVKRINDAEQEFNHVKNCIVKYANDTKALLHLKHIVVNVSAFKNQYDTASMISFKPTNIDTYSVLSGRCKIVKINQ